MLSDIEIAQQTTMRPIRELAEELGIHEEEWIPFGRFKAKLEDSLLRRLQDKPDGKLILVTAINPTPAGEGKTTTTAGLGEAMAKIGKRAVVALREPSLGPVFGVKGGAAGGGYAQVVPMEELNLHFTGDMHAITAANNLLCAMLDNHLQQGNELQIDPRRILIKRCMDMNDRALRNIVIGLGGKVNGVPREDGFIITVASEVMAILCLAADLDDLKKILGSLGETTTVIIYATGVDLFKNKKYLTDKNKRFADFCEKHGTVCNFEYKRASDLGKSISTYLSKSGCTITKSNAEYLANLCLCDTAFISKELEKLSAYADGREVTREDIDLLCIRRIESDGYSLAINILRGNAAMVFTRLRELDVQNYEPYAIIGIIGFSLADIYRAKLARSSGRSVADVAKDFSYAKNREFAVKNAYSECGNISAERIRKTLEILSETDLMLKTRSRGKDGDMLTLEQGLARSMALRC